MTRRGSQGVKVMTLDAGDKLVAVASVAGGEDPKPAAGEAR